MTITPPTPPDKRSYGRPPAEPTTTNGAAPPEPTIIRAKRRRPHAPNELGGADTPAAANASPAPPEAAPGAKAEAQASRPPAPIGDEEWREITEIRKAFWRNGYRIIPNYDKTSRLKAWNRPEWVAEQLSDTVRGSLPDRLETWPGRWPDNRATGVRIQDGLVPVDIDVNDAVMVTAIVAAIGEIAPDVAKLAPLRHGSGHKITLFARLAEGEELFGRWASKKYRKPGDTAESPSHGIEIFGGKPTYDGNCSRQFGVSGPHSYNDDGSVRIYYRWAEDRPALYEVAATALPVITREQASNICGRFNKLAEAAGWQEVKQPPKASDGSNVFYVIDENTRFDTNKGQDQINYDELCDLFDVVSDLRTTSTFYGDVGSNRTKGRVGWCEMFDCIGIWCNEEQAWHVPKALEPVSAAEQLAHLREHIETIKSSAAPGTSPSPGADAGADVGADAGGADAGDADASSFFDKVNAMFSDIKAWAPKVWPGQDTTYWNNLGNETAIELLIAKGLASDATEAALFLCKGAGIDPKTLGYSGNPSPSPSPSTSTSTSTLIEAKPFVLRDPKTLQKREWVYGRHLIRKFGSATFAPSGSGKSNLMIVEALAMTTGRALLGVQPPARARVWYWNGEDPMDELERRIGAACIHYGITAAEVEGWLFVSSGRDASSGIVIATEGRDGTKIATPVVKALIQTITDNKIDVVMIDPFISSHQVGENNNNAVDVVAKTWTMIADVTNTAIDLAHHTRKTGGAEVTVEDGRGAVALLNAVRPARVINTMTEDEAKRAGITDGRRRYFRVTDGKNNLALPVDKVDWFRSASVHLDNGDPADPHDHGDNVGVVTPWQWPDPLAGLKGLDFKKVAEAIRSGGPWRYNIQSNDWVGYPIGKALGWLTVGVTGPERAGVVKLIDDWIEAGWLVKVERPDGRRRLKAFVELPDETGAGSYP